MRTPALTYSPPPRIARVRRERRRSSGIPASGSARLAYRHRHRCLMLARLVAQAVAAVNERGLCAADIARLAELPPGEVRTMALRCGCSSCWLVRAN